MIPQHYERIKKKIPTRANSALADEGIVEPVASLAGNEAEKWESTPGRFAATPAREGYKNRNQ